MQAVFADKAVNKAIIKKTIIKKRSCDSLRITVLSFCSSSLILAVILGLGLCLFRMENTLSEKPYVLFSLAKISQQEFEMTIANKKIFLFTSNISYFMELISSAKDFLPPSLRLMAQSANILSDSVASRVCEYISSA